MGVGNKDKMRGGGGCSNSLKKVQAQAWHRLFP